MMTNAPPARERLLRPREVADRLAVSATTIRRLVAAGEIDAVRVGGQLRLDPAAVEEFVQRHREHDNSDVIA